MRTPPLLSLHSDHWRKGTAASVPVGGSQQGIPDPPHPGRREGGPRRVPRAPPLLSSQQRRGFGYTPLVVAALHNQTECFMALLEVDASLAFRSPLRFPDIHDAVLCARAPTWALGKKGCLGPSGPSSPSPAPPPGRGGPGPPVRWGVQPPPRGGPEGPRQPRRRPPRRWRPAHPPTCGRRGRGEDAVGTRGCVSVCPRACVCV